MHAAAMNKGVLGLLAAIIATGASLVFLQSQRNAELRAELDGLRSELRSISARSPSVAATTSPRGVTAEELERVRHESQNDIARLREDLLAAKKSLAETRVGQGSKGPGSGIPRDITPVSALSNAGKSTPSLSLQTLVWAAAGGDIDALSGGISLDPEAQARAQAMFDRLPEATRAQYGSADKLIALFIAKDVAVVSGLQVMNEEVMNDQARVKVLFQNSQGKTKEDDFRFRQADDGWRLAISAKTIDKFDRALSGKK